MTRLDEYHVPSVEDLEAARERLGISQSELSRRAGRESQAWNEIVQHNVDPQLSTVQAFLDALRDADADDQPELGRKPRLRSDGGPQEADD